MPTVAEPWAELKDQGIALIRVDRSDEAIIVLKRALKSVPDEERHVVFQALALAQQKVDPQAAIQSLTSAIKCSPQLEIESVLTYDRGVHRTEALASTGSPTASPRSSQKPANCAQPEIGQRLAG